MDSFPEEYVKEKKVVIYYVSLVNNQFTPHRIGSEPTDSFTFKVILFFFRSVLDLCNGLVGVNVVITLTNIIPFITSVALSSCSRIELLLIEKAMYEWKLTVFPFF